MMDLRYPNITGITEQEQIGQMRSYLHQLVEQLNWALGEVDKAQQNDGVYKGGGVYTKEIKESGTDESTTPQGTFNSIKALIIKSADIIKAYEETFFEDFNGKYFAESDFGTFIEETKLNIEKNSKGITENYENLQQIGDEVLTTNAYIKRGLLYYDQNGNAVYGIEVGETNQDGAFMKYARFIADRLSFFDSNGDEVAYIGSGCLYVNGKTVFLGEIQLGGYLTDTSDGLAFTWIGG